MEKCEENILKLKENSTLIQKQFQLDELEKVLKGLEMTISSEDRKIGDISGRIRELIARKQSLQEELVRRKEEMILMGASLGEHLNLWNREYEKLPKMEDIQRIQNFIKGNTVDFRNHLGNLFRLGIKRNYDIFLIHPRQADQSIRLFQTLLLQGFLICSISVNHNRFRQRLT